MNSEPVKWEPPALQESPVTPAQMLQMAVAQGADLDKLERLMGLQERWEANQAKKAYATAMAAFKANPPQLLKNKHVRYANSKGGFTEYDHATHDQVTDKIVAALARHDLMHCWTIEQPTPDAIKVTCTITHVLGHSESVSMMSAPDSSGGKNSIQAVASASTYLQRYTLLAATGMSSSELGAADTDGRGTEDKTPAGPEGFDNWWADMNAVCDEGTAALERAWQGAPKGCRAYVAKHHPAEWETLKQLAARVPA